MARSVKAGNRRHLAHSLSNMCGCSCVSSCVLILPWTGLKTNAFEQPALFFFTTFSSMPSYACFFNPQREMPLLSVSHSGEDTVEAFPGLCIYWEKLLIWSGGWNNYLCLPLWSLYAFNYESFLQGRHVHVIPHFSLIFHILPQYCSVISSRDISLTFNQSCVVAEQAVSELLAYSLRTSWSEQLQQGQCLHIELWDHNDCSFPSPPV